MLVSTTLALLAAAAHPAQTPGPPWHQGPGPSGNWSTWGMDRPPLRFSVRTGENILWRTPLPETGQGGIVTWGEHIFVATMAPWEEANALSKEEAEKFKHATENRKVVGKHIDAHCLDKNTGKILWTRRIEGSVPSIYSYPFSDATSASPVTDGEHVWFTNAGGQVVCFTVEGKQVWSRHFHPTFDGPFNKQFEPFLIEDEADGVKRKVFVHMEPFAAPDATDPKGLHGRWHYLLGLDAASGKVLWRSEDALTHYNAPTLGNHPDVKGPVIFHARGGPHAVPERPVGLSVTALTGTQAGKTVARFVDPRGNHEASLQTMAASSEGLCWVLKEPRSAIVILDPKSLEEKREISLTKGVIHRERDPETGEFHTREAVDLERGVFPVRYSAHAHPAQPYLFFQCYATAWGKPSIGPSYCFARVDTATGKVEYLEVPSGVERIPATSGRAAHDRFLWRTPGAARAINSRGVEVTGDDRSRWDGWDWVFNGSPSRMGERLYFTTAAGLVYVFDATAENWDEKALLAVNDLGSAGQTWTGNSLSMTGGRVYHRTAAELICVAWGAGEQN
jgi:outer membrane protein assembly factor BamB